MKTTTKLISSLILGLVFNDAIVAQDYCIPPGFKDMGGVGEPFTFISNVQLQNLNNSTGMPTGQGDDNGYTYFDKAPVPVLQKSTGYSLKVKAVDNLGSGMEVDVWIYWNGDKDFDDAGEKVGYWTTAGDLGTDIIVPANAFNGIVRMRVYCDMPPSMGHIPVEPCGYLNHPTHVIGQHGEVEDYDLQIGSPTGIDVSKDASTFDVYPVPASNILNVSNGLQQALPYKLVDVYGREVMQGKLEAGINALDVANLNSGQYILMIMAEDQPILKTLFIAQ